MHHPITAKRQPRLRLAWPGHDKRSGFQLLARACLLSRRITRFRTYTITTVTSANVTSIATAVTNHHHRQSFLSPFRPPQQTTAFTNARDASRRGRTDQSHGQPHLSLSHPSLQTTTPRSFEQWYEIQAASCKCRPRGVHWGQDTGYDLDLEVEISAFLGIQIDQDSTEGTFTLTQKLVSPTVTPTRYALPQPLGYPTKMVPAGSMQMKPSNTPLPSACSCTWPTILDPISPLRFTSTHGLPTLLASLMGEQ
jgi:hypothetical protein